MDDADADPLQIIEPFAALPFVVNWGCAFKKTKTKTKRKRCFTKIVVVYYFEQLGGPADAERKCGERCSLVERQEGSQEQLSAASLRWLHVWSLQQMGEQLSPVCTHTGCPDPSRSIQVQLVQSGLGLNSSAKRRDAMLLTGRETREASAWLVDWKLSTFPVQRRIRHFHCLFEHLIKCI